MLVKFLIKKKGGERKRRRKRGKRKKEKEGKEERERKREIEERTNLIQTLHVPLNHITTVSGVCFSDRI
jgi:hypothetical protein